MRLDLVTWMIQMLSPLLYTNSPPLNIKTILCISRLQVKYHIAQAKEKPLVTAHKGGSCAAPATPPSQARHLRSAPSSSSSSGGSSVSAYPSCARPYPSPLRLQTCRPYPSACCSCPSPRARSCPSHSYPSRPSSSSD
ncbi:hypothetical protein BDZ89DRAFT_572193 [Hymenopellis radicata]|nr:hypothetical protein BDZ89DRAFT_572193 [Hymenopellis radicata]